MNPENGMICPVCGQGTLCRQSKREEFEYNGHKKTIGNYPVFVCNSCAEEFVSADDTKLFEKDLTDFQREVDGLLKPDEIRAIREKLGYNQTEFARLLKVGEKNFARYETGVSPQSRYLDWLMRILSQYPESIRVIDPKLDTRKGYRIPQGKGLKKVKIYVAFGKSGKWKQKEDIEVSSFSYDIEKRCKSKYLQ